MMNWCTVALIQVLTQMWQIKTYTWTFLFVNATNTKSDVEKKLVSWHSLHTL